MMKQLLLYRPYHLLGIASLLLFAVGFFVGKQSIDIHLHDTYFIIGYDFLLTSIGLLFLLIWLLYLPLRKKLCRPLILIHVGTTILCLVVAAVCLAGSLERSYVDLSAHRNANGLFVLTVLVFVIAQLIFLVNFIAALFRRIH